MKEVISSEDEILSLVDASPAEERSGCFLKSSPFITTAVLLPLFSSSGGVENFRKVGLASEHFLSSPSFPTDPADSSPILGRECW